ncbi:IS3 family transposase [Streptomyces avermitilis]|uniref:IS3 family transposase n=1 Tax=Streptomyces avermitilis TaxID=33903 RepID=UPI003F4B1DF7
MPCPGAGHGLKIATSTYHAAEKRTPSARAIRDADSLRVYGVRMVWRQLGRSGGSCTREGVAVARCTVARLMRDLGLEGARRGRKIRTTLRTGGHERVVDLLQRDFTASRHLGCGHDLADLPL